MELFIYLQCCVDLACGMVDIIILMVLALVVQFHVLCDGIFDIRYFIDMVQEVEQDFC